MLTRARARYILNLYSAATDLQHYVRSPDLNAVIIQQAPSDKNALSLLSLSLSFSLSLPSLSPLSPLSPLPANDPF